MKIKNKRLFVLSSIFGILLFCWWLMTPVRYYIPENFGESNIEKISHQWNLFDIIESGSGKRYNRNTIVLPMSIYRQLYSEKPYGIFSDWISMLTLTGHYDEALNNIDSLQPPTCIDIIKLTFADTYFYNDTSVADFMRMYFNQLKLSNKYYKTDFSKNKESLKQFVLDKQNDKFNQITFYKEPVPECTPKRDRTKINGEYATKCGIQPYTIHLIQNNKLDDAASALNKYNGYKYATLLNNTYLRLGIKYMKRHEYSKAISFLEEVVEFQDYNYKAHEKLVECYRKTGQTQKANYHEKIMKELLAL